ncbi:uncharacterized protein LOC128200024 [Galleria mellonella]|uniref:Uncharacterized protein LOC128200024 n=1 Tax=Galleria mellonella TaxID=7137 RepID=A0ABM3M903_GALME|nr:uncharacterized protein LOC128200024 [Galleria mellonella]
MSTKSTEVAIRELTKTVLSLQSKVLSLEKVIIDQYKLIKNLIGDEKVSSKSIISDGEGSSTSETGLRPIREARIRASSAIAGATKKATMRNNTDRATTSTGGPPTPCAPSTPDNNHEAIVTLTSDTGAEATDSAREWIEIKRPRTRRSLVNVTRGTAIPTDNNITLSAAQRKSYLHLYYVKIGTTVEQVNEYLRTICPGDNCSAEALKSRGDYASFKLSVPTKHLDKYLASENWIEDVYIRPWRSGFRKKIDDTAQV